MKAIVFLSVFSINQKADSLGFVDKNVSQQQVHNLLFPEEQCTS
jgi:hypothetical protein